jgi:hypothetical protein
MACRILGLTLLTGLVFSSCEMEESIDRYSLVNRHNIYVDEFDTLATLSVGNGNFAFTTDFTGLQTFYKEYENGVSLGTQSNWGWHTEPNIENYDITETYYYYEIENRKVPFRDQRIGPDSSPRASEAISYFRENPHRIHLGLIRLVIKKENGEEIEIHDVHSPTHHLDLWRGEITSDFTVEGNPVKVMVYSHQEKDMISARVESPLINLGRLSIEWLFPYAIRGHYHPGYDFNSPGKHTSALRMTGKSNAEIIRILDNDSYYVYISWSDKATLEEKQQHNYILNPAPNSGVLEFSCLFTPEMANKEIPGFSTTKDNSLAFWKNFWETGGAVDFSNATDPRAHELERRVVLSQYLTRINGSGDLPPQETGLTYNSWFGKFHMEMIWWHSAHYHNWQRSHYAENQIKYYRDIIEPARKTAELQGYKGVRWPKMTCPAGENSPGGINTYLLWQQPHLIYFAEQLYKDNPSPEVLDKYADLVFATADFMADFPIFDETEGAYNLAPPFVPAQEHWNRETAFNSPFELAYWYWGLTTAQKWKERMGQKPDAKWEAVSTNLAVPVSIDGLYMGLGNAPDSYTNPANMRDHPIVLGMLGFLPDWDKLDHEIMLNTLIFIMENWDWPSTWGWDYPLVAMNATRLYKPEIAIDALMRDVQKNTYLQNGHNYQHERLRIYLPGNGGLLKAVALMCAGWEGSEAVNPGFPKDGTWDVRWENLTPDF